MSERNRDRLREVVAVAKSPVIGIPVMLESGDFTCIRVRRDMLTSALVHAQVAYWDESSSRLVLNGGKRSCYKLMSLDRYQVHAQLYDWAKSQRKRVVSKTAPPSARKLAKLEKEIGVLVRERDKISLTRPVNPMCQKPREDAWEQGDYVRESESVWRAGKAIRKALAKEFTAKALQSNGFTSRPDWKSLYANAARILNLETIPDHDRHSRITKLRNGPSLNEYLRAPEKYLAHMHKPWSRGQKKTWDEEKALNVEMREARQRFLEHMSMCRAIDGQIENLREVQKAVREAELIEA